MRSGGANRLSAAMAAVQRASARSLAILVRSCRTSKSAVAAATSASLSSCAFRLRRLRSASLCATSSAWTSGGLLGDLWRERRQTDVE